MSDQNVPVSKALTEMGILHRVFRHPGPVHSLEQAAQERGQQPEQVVRSIVFRLAKESFIMILVAGPAQISWSALRKYFNQSRLTMATPSEVLQATGYQTGAVSPFGLPAPMPIYIDNSVLKQEEVSIGSGLRGVTVILRTEDLMRALGDVQADQFTGE